MESVIDGVYFVLQDAEDLDRLCRLTWTEAGKGVVRLQKAVDLFTLVVAIANWVVGTVEITGQTVNLSIGNVQPVFQRESMIFAKYLASIRKSKSNGVSEVAVFCVLETLVAC